MSESTTADLEQLGRDAAVQLAGADAIEAVEVVPGYDGERPVYYFRFLIDAGRSRQRIGLLHIRLGQRLLDELIARSDDHYPEIRLLSRADWDKRAGV
jgi:hypothetical protein